MYSRDAVFKSAHMIPLSDATVYLLQAQQPKMFTNIAKNIKPK